LDGLAGPLQFRDPRPIAIAFEVSLEIEVEKTFLLNLELGELLKPSFFILTRRP